MDEKDLKRFLNCDVSREEFFRIERHIAECESCKDALRRLSSVRLQEFATGAECCPDYEELSRYVDGEKMSPEFMSHIRSCELCARDIRTIRKARLMKPAVRRLTWQRFVWIPAAAAAALAAFMIWHSPQTVPTPDKPAVVASLPDDVSAPTEERVKPTERIVKEEDSAAVAPTEEKSPKPAEEVKTEEPKEPEKVSEKTEKSLADAQKKAADEIKKEIKNEVKENKETKLAAVPKEEKTDDAESVTEEKTFDPVEIAASPNVRLRGGNEKVAEEPGEAVNSAPKAVAKSPKSAPATLTWSKAEGADSYKVEVFASDGNKVEEAITKGTSYTPTKLEAGKNYTVRYSYRANETDPWHPIGQKRITK
ncbi:MAG: hypothetical protein J6U98_06885 [Abditibacteriota bacterium]|nr:hypothetical protein [Abditibacteriota bacterium]